MSKDQGRELQKKTKKWLTNLLMSSWIKMWMSMKDQICSKSIEMCSQDKESLTKPESLKMRGISKETKRSQVSSLSRRFAHRP